MLKGRKIGIRAIDETDISTLVKCVSDLDNQGDYLPTKLPSSMKLRSQYNKDGFISEVSEQYVIVNKTDEIIGSIWLFKSVPYFDAVEVGYHIFDYNNRSKGNASEALHLFHNYIFESKQVNRIELRIATTNTASQKMAVKLGFNLEGTNREAAYSKGKLHDMDIYAMLRKEWLINQSIR